jgi:hypothetical protein
MCSLVGIFRLSSPRRDREPQSSEPSVGEPDIEGPPQYRILVSGMSHCSPTLKQVSAHEHGG